MPAQRHAWIAIAFLASCAGSSVWAGEPAATSAPFPLASVRFEQNATDRDVEVVFEITGRREGLAKLRILSPDRRTVVDFTASDQSTLGIRQFVFESPEPRDVAALKAAYPEGTYTFEGLTASGAKLHGAAVLKHVLPPTTQFVWPKAKCRDAPAIDLVIRWATVAPVAAYIVEIEQDELSVNLTAMLPADEAQLAVPNGFLQPQTEYQLSIGTVSDDGNISYIETTFTTAPPQ